MIKRNQDFLKSLQREAKIQSSLQNEKLIPDFLSEVSSFVVENLWQVLLILSIFLAIIWQFLPTIIYGN